MIFSKFKNKLNSFIKNSFGLEIKRLSKSEYDIIKARNIINRNKKIKVLTNLTKKYPNNPQVFLELLICLSRQGDPSQFEVMMEYGKIREKWLKDTGFDQLNVEFINADMLTGSIGNLYAIENLIQANELGLREKKKIFTLLPKNAKFKNLAITEYFKKYINFLNSEDSNQDFNQLQNILTLPIGLCLPIKNECLYFDMVANRCEKEMQKKKLNNSTFKLKEGHYEKGVSLLTSFGLPKDAWYVTMHVREPGFKVSETTKNSTQGFRNSNPINYVKAIKRIINSGGWVFRMGDPSMTPMPKIKGLIDYAHSPLKSEIMDVFLAATSKFCLGTSSGYFRLPRYFGVPVIFSNCANPMNYYSLKKKDLYLPRLIKKKINNENIKISEMMSTPISLYQYKHQFNNAGLYWVENSPEEIDFAVEEMLERIKVNPQNCDLSEKQIKFKQIVEENSDNYGKSLEAFAPCNQHLLNNNINLF